MDTDAYWYADLRNVGSYRSKPVGEAVFGKPYGWVVWVFIGPDSYGQSYYYQTVNFLPGTAVSAALQGGRSEKGCGSRAW